MNKPIEHCYWVVPGKLLAGEYPGAKEAEEAREKVAKLTDAGIAAFIDLTEENERLAPYAAWTGQAEHLRFGIPDVSVPSSRERTAATLDAIDERMEAEKLVYVHCWGGVGRTGLVIGCWLARHCGSGSKALERVAELWKTCPKSQLYPESPETTEQKNYVRNWRN